MKLYSRLISLFTILALSVSFALANDDPTAQQSAEQQVIAREKAAWEAWQKKDKAYYMDYLSKDATYFGAMSPYLEIDPHVNFLPKFEEFAEQFKLQHVQMYNPRVQIYGDTAILTYNASVMASFSGQPMNYSAKITVVMVRQGNTWRVVHGHESMNPAPRP